MKLHPDAIFRPQSCIIVHDRNRDERLRNYETLARQLGLQSTQPKTHKSPRGRRCRPVVELLPDGQTREFRSSSEAANRYRSSWKLIVRSCDSGGVEEVAQGRRFRWKDANGQAKNAPESTAERADATVGHDMEKCVSEDTKDQNVP